MTDRVRTLLPVLLALGLSACWPAGTLEKRKTVTDHQRERAEAAREGGPVAALPRPPVEVLPEGRDPAVKPGEEALAVDLQALAEACRGGGASACLTLGLIKDQGVGVSPDPA
ncbi:MAG: hypothetical protein FJ098_10510, partial [Deltaproteobacteria bacterium]|nr:hypothetical protein [Deltaproteobacteria bacterium]